MNTCRIVIIEVAAMAVMVSSTYAIPLIEGTSVTLPGTTEAAHPYLAGLVLQDQFVSFNVGLPGGGQITGSIQERVVRENTTGTLDFYWRVLSDANSAGNLGYFRIGNFITHSYDADWRIDGSGQVNPNNAYLFGGSLSGLGYVNFGFDSGLPPGESSRFIFLHTDATAYALTANMDVATAGTLQASQLFSTFAPASAVPDGGSTLMLMGLAMGGFAVVLRRKLDS